MKKRSKYFVYDALKILIDISKNTQEAHKEDFNYLSPTGWLQEVCTIQITTARRGGHTEAAYKLIEEDNMNIGYIAGIHDIARMFQDRFNRHIKRLYKHDVGWFYDFGNLEFCCSRHNWQQEILGKDLSAIDAIIFDNAFMLSKKQKDEILRSLFPAIFPQRDDRPFYLIFLQ